MLAEDSAAGAPSTAGEQQLSQQASGAPMSAEVETFKEMVATGSSTSLKAIFFDFDSIISVGMVKNRRFIMAMDYNAELIQSFTQDEREENSGGLDRIRKYAQLLESLRSSGVQLYIISTGFKSVFGPLLDSVGLLRFFVDSQVFGQVEQMARTGGCDKGKLIQQIMLANSWTHDEALFIDDSEKNIASARGVCQTYHIPQPKEFGKHGMWDPHFEHIRQVAGL